jgi:hypothetical protein
MRVVWAAVALLVTQVGLADTSSFDRALVLGAGRAYIESYARLHFPEHTPQFEWDKPVVEFVASKHGSYAGYVGLFVRNAAGAGCGIAYFEVVKSLPGHLFPVTWGYSSFSISDEESRFLKDAKLGRLPQTSWQ